MLMKRLKVLMSVGRGNKMKLIGKSNANYAKMSLEDAIRSVHDSLWGLKRVMELHDYENIRDYRITLLETMNRIKSPMEYWFENQTDQDCKELVADLARLISHSKIYIRRSSDMLVAYVKMINEHGEIYDK